MEQPLVIAFKDTESSESIEALIRERASRLDTFHPNIISCRVVIEIPHKAAASGKNPLGIKIEVSVPGRNTIVAKDWDERRDSKRDDAAWINRAFEAVERQLKEAAQTMQGTVKQHEGAVDTGQVVRLFPERDYGFVELRGYGDLYFTRNSVIGGDFDELEVGMLVHVTPATGEGPMGPQASSVRPFTAASSPR